MNFKGWMDVDNMSVDIYDSMAAGVQGAGVVVCFMSQQYQDSENCKLELKFAQQSGMAIVPCMMQDNWKASGWLGIICAGKKWQVWHLCHPISRESTHGAWHFPSSILYLISSLTAPYCDV